MSLRDRGISLLLLLVILGLFVAFDKAAFQSYFSDDDFSNLALVQFMPWLTILKETFSFGFKTNVRPIGLAYYKILEQAAHLHFVPYVAVLQALHVATALMLWLFLRRLGVQLFAAALGCFFFTMHMSVLPAYWKPMYVFDVLCGFWVVMALLFYQRDRFLLSFLCAWLAFRSKEMELMLPLLLLMYEWQFGKKRWKPLIPFFLMSLSFGLQGLLQPIGPGTPYSMQLTLAGLWSGLAFYGGKLLYATLLGLAISAALLFIPLRLIRFGVLGFWILLMPMLLFPEKQAGAYLSVPLLAFAMAIAGVAEWKPWLAALFLAIWIPASYGQLRVNRRPIIAYHYGHRPYVEQVLASFAARPVPTVIVYEGTPLDFSMFGQEGLFRYALNKYDLPVYDVQQPEALETTRRPGAILLTWNAVQHRLLTDVFPGAGHELSYVDFDQANPVWQLKDGWKAFVGGCRWVGPQAVMTLREPLGATTFSMRVNLAPGQAERLHQLLQVSSQGHILGQYQFAKSGFQTISWPVSSTIGGVKDFEITVSPEFRPSPETDALGVVICACGFLDRGLSQQ